jgi:hypothetical protein
MGVLRRVYVGDADVSEVQPSSILKIEAARTVETFVY